MKKIISSILLLAISLTLISCGEEFEPVKSTKEEEKTVLTIEYGGEKYEVAYELYRALFLTYKKEIDEGDANAWSGEDAEENEARINAMIFDSIAEIYSAFYICDTLDIDVYSRRFDKKVDEYISASVDNIIIELKAEAAEEGKTVELSREQAYQIYLARLKEENLNYSVSVLLYRYELALAAIDEYYRGEASSGSVTGYKGGEIEFTEDDVKAFYNSDDTVKLIQLYLRKSYVSLEDAKEIRASMAAAGSKDDVIGIIIGESLAGSAEEVENGLLIGKYTLDTTYFSDYTEAAFDLAIGEVSEVVEAFDGDSSAYYILYRDEKSNEHFASNYPDVAYAYVSDKIGRIKSEAREGILGAIKLADGYADIIHREISM